MLQAAKPWMSDTDIEKGSRGLDEVGRALEGMKVGIICLTPENLKEEWILYEAGALSKTLDAKTRVCTYLLGGLQPQDVKAPLGMFQWTKAEKDDTRKLVHTINKNLDAPISEKVVNAVFDRMWPDLEMKLSTLPSAPGALPPKRSVEEMVAEILELNRTMAPEVREIADETEFARQDREFQESLRTAMGGTAINTNTRSAIVYNLPFKPMGKLADLAGPFGIATATVQNDAAPVKPADVEPKSNAAFYGELPPPVQPTPPRPRRRRG